MANQIKFTDKEWQLVTTVGTVALVQGIGTHVQIEVGGALPVVSDVGFDLEQGTPMKIPNVDLFGGHIYARSTSGKGSLRYVVA